MGLSLHRRFLDPWSRDRRTWGDELPELVLFQVLVEFAVDRNGDRARLFGDNEDDSILFFAEAEGSVVAGTEAFRDFGVLAEGEHAASADDPPFTNQEATIVEGAPRLKNRLNEEAVDLGVEGSPFVSWANKLIETCGAFEGDQSADAAAGHVTHGDRKLVDDFILSLIRHLPEEPAEDAVLTQLCNRAANLGLENYDEADNGNAQDAVIDMLEANEVERLDQDQGGNEEDRDEDGETPNYPGSTSLHQELQHDVEESGEDRDL